MAYSMKRVFLHHIVIVCIMVERTVSQLFAPEVTYTGYPGEQFEYSLTQLADVGGAANRPYYMASTNTQLALNIPRQFTWAYNYDRKVQGCTGVMLNSTDNVIVCLQYPNDYPAGNQWLLSTFVTVCNDAKNWCWMDFLWATYYVPVNLCTGIEYIISSSINLNEVILMGTKYDPATAKTSIYYAKVPSISTMTFNVVPPGILLGSCTTPLLVNGKFELKKDHLYTKYNDWDIFANSADTDRGWNSAANPTNTKLLMIKLTTNPPAIYLNDVSSNLDYIFDIWYNTKLWIIGLHSANTASANVRIYYKEVDSAGAVYAAGDNSGQPLVVDGSFHPREFYHFAPLGNQNITGSNYWVLISHKWDPSKPDTQQTIQSNLLWWNQVIPNPNDVWAIRPSELLNIKVRNFGRPTSFMNIKYYQEDRVLYLDQISSYKMTIPSAPPWTISNLFHFRSTVGLAEEAINFPKNQLAMESYVYPSAGFSVSSLLIRDYVINSYMAPELWNDAFTNIIQFQDPMPSNKTHEVNITYHVNVQPSANTFKQNATQKFTLSYRTSYFDQLSIVSPFINTNNDVMKNSYIGFNIQWYELYGCNVSLSLLSPNDLNINFLDNKQHFITFNRSDLDTSNIADSDQIYYVGGGALFEDQNRKIGFATCTEKGNYNEQTFERSCRQVASIESMGQTIVAVRDYNTNKMCKSVMFILENKITKEKVFYGFYLPENKFIWFGNITGGLSGYDIGCTPKTYNGYGYNKGPGVPVKEFVYILANGTIDIPIDANHMMDSYPNLVDSMFVKVGTTLSYMTHKRYEYLKMSKFGSAEGRFDIVGPPYRYFGYQDYNWDAFYTMNDVTYTGNSTCFFPTSWIVYSTDLNIQPKITAMFGQWYADKSAKFYERRVFDLRQLNFTNMKLLFCHRLDVTEAFSVYGEQVVTDGGITITRSIIATFTVNSTDHNKKVYNILNTTKKFIKVESTDDGNREIYFDLKEFSNSQFYRVQFPETLLLGYLGNNNYPIGTAIPLKFEAKNNFKSTQFGISLKYNPLPVITVVPKTDQDYVQYKQLDILQDITASITGPIFTIDLAPGSNTKILSNRVNIKPSIKLTSRNKVLSYSSTVSFYSSYQTETLLLRDEQAFYFFYNFAYLGFCNIGSLTVDTFRAISVQSKFNRIHVVFSSNINFFGLYFDNSTTPSTCTGPFKLTSDEPTNATEIDIVYNATHEYMLVPNLAPTQTDTEYILSILRSDYNSFGNVTAAYYRFSRLSYPVTTKKFMQRESQEPIPFVVAPNLYFKYCTAVQPLTSNLNWRMTLCLTTNVSKTNASSGLILINHNTHVAERAYDYFNYSISSISDLSTITSMQCLHLTDLTISCVFTLSQSFGTYRRFFLNRDTTSVGCTNIRKFCFTITPSEMVNYPNPVSNYYYAVSHSTNYTVSVAKKKQGSYVLDDFYLTIFKHGLSEQYYGMDTGKYPSVDNVAYGFFGYSPNIYYVFDTYSSQMKLFEISELKLEVTEPLLKNLNAQLLFSNPMISPDIKTLNLQTIFKTQIIPVPPPPPPKPTPIWQVYWWVPLPLIAAGLVIYYIAHLIIQRRKYLLEQQRKKEVVLTNLKDFYY